jgi:hypothetical protein
LVGGIDEVKCVGNEQEIDDGWCSACFPMFLSCRWIGCVWTAHIVSSVVIHAPKLIRHSLWPTRAPKFYFLRQLYSTVFIDTHRLLDTMHAFVCVFFITKSTSSYSLVLYINKYALPEKQALPCQQTLSCALARQRFLCRATAGQSTATTRPTANPPKSTRQRFPHGRGVSKRTAKKDGTATAQESARQRHTTRQSRPPLP